MGAWVLRRNDGTIWSACATQQLDSNGQPLSGQQFLADDNADLVAFRTFTPVPASASAGDFMRALYDLGWYDDAKAAVAAAGGLAEILWDRAAKFERDDPLLAQVATAISKTSTDLDALFTKAASYS